MKTGAVSVSPGDVPRDEDDAAELTDAARERQQRPADDRGSDRAGSTTFRNESQAPAPSVAAASSSAGSSSRSTGWTWRTTSGSVTTQRASRIPTDVNATWIPKRSRNFPIGAFGP